MQGGGDREKPHHDWNDWLVHISVMKEKGSLSTIPFHPKNHI
jgi:hypothetical protein